MARKNIASQSPFEEEIGFSRAVRVGQHIFVSGTAPIEADGSTSCPGDAYGQTRRCLDIIREAIESGGGVLSDVIRTRVYITDVSKWKEVAKALGEYLHETKPAATMVEVKGLIREDWLVEIEAEAIVAE